MVVAVLALRLILPCMSEDSVESLQSPESIYSKSFS